MQFRNTTFSNNYGNKGKEQMFDKICTEFNSFKGDPLGRGSYGRAYKLENFGDFFQNSKNIVVKEIDTNGARSTCMEKTRNKPGKRGQEGPPLIIGTKNDQPEQVEAFYCYGNNTVLSEYYISLCASLLNSENFIETYIYKDCINEGKQYIFMEQIDTTFRKYLETYTPTPSNQRKFDAIVVQLLHALWCLHKAGINHYDSKADNIFLKKADGYITKDGSRLQEYDYVEYDFGTGSVIKIPVKDIDYVVKVGDFGLSQKYSEPRVLTDYIEQYFILDYLSPFYDIMLAFADIHDNTSPLYKTIQSFILGFDESINFVTNEFNHEKINKLWPGIHRICDKTCSRVKTMDNIIKTYTQENLEYLLKKKFDKFARCIFFNKNDADKDRRQIYNFKLSQMKDSVIDIVKIISTGFFQEQLKQYGWDQLDSHSVLKFGGPGPYKFPRSADDLPESDIDSESD
jgi:hypothetical protein